MLAPRPNGSDSASERFGLSVRTARTGSEKGDRLAFQDSLKPESCDLNNASFILRILPLLFAVDLHHVFSW